MSNFWFDHSCVWGLVFGVEVELWESCVCDSLYTVNVYLSLGFYRVSVMFDLFLRRSKQDG